MLIDGHLQEVNWYKERYRSWFIGDSVLEDGSIYLCTPVDPLFLALPLMESSRMQVKLSHHYLKLQGKWRKPVVLFGISKAGWHKACPVRVVRPSAQSLRIALPCRVSGLRISRSSL